MEKGHRRGFTLVEVMIVMLLFSMLLLMIFPMRRMAVWVLDHARTQEQAEMLGDAAWRYVADRLRWCWIQSPAAADPKYRQQLTNRLRQREGNEL